MNNTTPKIKIGILTFHRSINYGAFLQSWALSQRLKSDFNFEVEIINFEYAKKNIWQKLIVLKRSRLIHLYQYLMQYFAFRKSLKALPLSKKTFINFKSKNVEKYINWQYDYVIVGSDAVWSYNSFNLGVDNVYFLRNVKTKKASYAACAFGIDYNNIPQIERNIIKEALDCYAYIGVRDKGTLKFVQENSQNSNIYLNCDPTILMKKPGSNLLPNIMKRHKLNCNKPIIGIMLDYPLICKKIRETFGEQYQIVSLFNHSQYADFYLYDLTPFEWSQIFQQFEILFTSYFHGSIVCLKNEVPVISIQGYPYNEKYISKIEQIFYDLDLPEYCFIASKINDEDIERMMTLAKTTIENKIKTVEKIKIGLEKEEKKYDSFFNFMKSIE
jgi:hypothetical protein